MGIPHLNKYLFENCSKQSISKKQLECFKGKTIAVDTSIYLYKFIAENALIENMYLLISIFQTYKITPIFVFDGKAPEEKKELLIQRIIEKNKAETKYNELRKQLEKIESEEDKNEISIEMDSLKKKFIRIKDTHIKSVKEILDIYNISYFDAPGEADCLCAELVHSDIAWACLSDDMDMLVYGCTRVMRHISLLKHSVIFYNIVGVLRELDMSLSDFRKIAVVSGTDYNIKEHNILYKTINYYKEYKSEKLDTDFYEWLLKKTNYIKNIDELNKIYKMFDVNNQELFLEKYKNVKSIKKPNINTIVSFLKPYGFIFV